MPWFDIAVGLLLLNGLFAGWRLGFFASALRCLSLVLALYLTGLIRSAISFSPSISVLSMVITFAVALWLSRLLLNLVTGSSYGRFGLPDSLLGALTNTLFTAVMLWIVCTVILSLSPDTEWIRDSQAYPLLDELVGPIAPSLRDVLSPTSPLEPPATEVTDL